MRGIFRFMTPCSLVHEHHNTRPRNSKDQNMIAINYLFPCHIQYRVRKRVTATFRLVYL